jgi:hypothetical protein
MALKLPTNPGLCDALAQKYGALAPTEFGCVPVSGKEIKITDSTHSVMEGFETTNYNFHTGGVKPALQNSKQLPGPTDDGAGTTNEKVDALNSGSGESSGAMR